jgi:hypothetical protein
LHWEFPTLIIKKISPPSNDRFRAVLLRTIKKEAKSKLIKTPCPRLIKKHIEKTARKKKVSITDLSFTININSSNSIRSSAAIKIIAARDDLGRNFNTDELEIKMIATKKAVNIPATFV